MTSLLWHGKPRGCQAHARRRPPGGLGQAAAQSTTVGPSLSHASTRRTAPARRFLLTEPLCRFSPSWSLSLDRSLSYTLEISLDRSLSYTLEISLYLALSHSSRGGDTHPVAAATVITPSPMLLLRLRLLLLLLLWRLLLLLLVAGGSCKGRTVAATEEQNFVVGGQKLRRERETVRGRRERETDR